MEGTRTRRARFPGARALGDSSTWRLGGSVAWRAVSSLPSGRGPESEFTPQRATRTPNAAEGCLV